MYIRQFKMSHVHVSSAAYVPNFAMTIAGRLTGAHTY